jgi:chemotaxis protein MotA
MISDGVLMIRDGKSPTLVREMLLAYILANHREHGEEAEGETAAAAA